MSAGTDIERPYHHRDLEQAILKEAERILESEGIQALTLRAAARAVGVSHTAPRNHFGDLAGLLSELAAAGYRRFAEALTQSAATAGGDPKGRLRAMGRAYLRFATDHPGLFTLMFRGEQLDRHRPALRNAMGAARTALQAAVAARVGSHADAPPLVQAGRIAAARALVHGFAVLMMENRLVDLLASAPGADMESLFEAMLDSIVFVDIG